MISLYHILNVIINCLNTNKNKFYVNHYQIVTFFDFDFPLKLRQYAFSLPIIYYNGDVKLFNSIAICISSYSPSFYAQKTIKKLSSNLNLLHIQSNTNSITKDAFMYDIIYCNDMRGLQFKAKSLSFYIGGLEAEYFFQVLSLIGQSVYMIEGYPSKMIFKFLNNCIDNNLEIYALPTNIYSNCGKLPNSLILEGATPLLLD